MQKDKIFHLQTKWEYIFQFLQLAQKVSKATDQDWNKLTQEGWIFWMHQNLGLMMSVYPPMLSMLMVLEYVQKTLLEFCLSTSDHLLFRRFYRCEPNPKLGSFLYCLEIQLVHRMPLL